MKGIAIALIVGATLGAIVASIVLARMAKKINEMDFLENMEENKHE